MASAAVGIDLGTTFSAVAHVNEHGVPEVLPNAEGDRITDSVILFEDNDVIIPIFAIEEIDQFKREGSERGRNARTIARLLDEPVGGLAHGRDDDHDRAVLRALHHAHRDPPQTLEIGDAAAAKFHHDGRGTLGRRHGGGYSEDRS